jgi:L-rhamnonate dehydratase
VKITNIRLRQLQGTMTGAPFREERPASPRDIYPAFRHLSPMGRKPGDTSAGETRKVTQVFLLIETDEGVTGVAGPLYGEATAVYIERQLKPLVIGQDPMMTEYLWDIMYRTAVNGRMGENMIAISYIDVALWDIKGKYLKQPVVRLLGGPVQERLPVYVSTVGNSLALNRVKELTAKFKAEGFCGTKWFLRNGPPDGLKGERENIEIIATAREVSGPEIKIMVDAWAYWDIPYTLRMAEAMKEYDVTWIEEPLPFALRDGYAELNRRSPIPIAGGEHEFTRWNFKELMDMKAMSYFQPEPMFAGGISEMFKIGALAATYGAQLVYHVYYPVVSAHVSLTQNSLTVPMGEYLYNGAQENQFFLKNPQRPLNGFYYPSNLPGIGMDIDESKIEAQKDL